MKLPSLLVLLPLVLALAAPAAEAKTRSKSTKTRATRTTLATPGTPYSTSAEAMAFADDMAERRNLDQEWTRRAIGQAQRLPAVIRLMQPAPAGVAKNWSAYRSRFIDPVRIAAGVRFWEAHRDTLRRAESEFGVPPEIVVAIIGVETIYGQHMGNFRVVDALSTLAFDFPSSHPRARERQAFFRSELEQFLSLHQRNGTDPLLPRGSYAGAMGMPQFMPSSWVRHAVDFDGDGRIDLFGSAADAIGSVASYFRAHHWKTGMPAYYAVRLESTPAQKEQLLAPDILPTFSPAHMQGLGATLEPQGLQHNGPLALVELQNGDAPAHYVAGTENFYAITRYNWSSYYALAVIELGQAVAAALPRP